MKQWDHKSIKKILDNSWDIGRKLKTRVILYLSNQVRAMMPKYSMDTTGTHIEAEVSDMICHGALYISNYLGITSGSWNREKTIGCT